MGQFDFDAAARAFDALHQAQPDWPEGRLNLAIALMNRQGTGDAERAEALLRQITAPAGVARRARYTLGLLLAHEARDAEALPLLEETAQGDPPDGFAAYFAGQLRLSADPAGALRWHQRAAQAAPLLRSAHYGTFLALRRLNRDDEAATALARFQALERHPQAVVAEFKYTRMGPLSEAVAVDAPGAAPPSAPSGPRFLDAVPLAADAGARWATGAWPRSITIADINGDGALDVFVAGALDGPGPNAVLLGRDASTFTMAASHPLSAIANVNAALWGDLDDDGLVDVVLCRPAGGTRIWRQTAPGVWADVTPAAGVDLGRSDMVDGAVFDADHDGDLDIWLVNRSGPNELLNNDGGGRFRAIGTEAGIAGDGRPSIGIAVADFDNDRDADVMVIKASPPHDVFLNGRVWEYRRDEGAGALVAAPVDVVLAGDVDADGHPELYSSGRRGLERWTRDAGGAWRAAPIAAPGGSLAIVDTDGDGTLELFTGSGLTRAGGGGAAPAVWTVGHFDPAAGPSIVGLREDGVPVVWRPGPGRHNFLALSLSGRDPSSDQRRSNVSGIGARVAVRVASRWTALDTTRPLSGPGQSHQPASVGLGGAARADFVAVTWADGVFQTELALEAGRLHRINETQRQLSSCPVLFAWDGNGFRFVTDVLGVGGIGFFESPGVYSAPHPRENVLLPAGAMPIVDGAFRLQLAEPMEEITYLDHAALVAYDLPPGWRMTLDERKAINGPAPGGGPLFYREERLPARATGAGGADVTAAVLSADRQAAGPARVHPRFIGLADPFAVTLTFDRPIDRGPGRPTLLVDGWIEYPYAQTVFAAWQAGAVYEAPSLDALGADGRWHEVAREFGYPAGMPRQMALPLPPLPPGTTALRLRTSQEIYWDRVAVIYTEPLPAARRLVTPLRSAVLGDVGFARRTTGPQRVPEYDAGTSAPLADTRHPRGWYTAFGSIDPLVSEADDAVAIFGPGEGITLDYEAPPPPPAGWTRRLVLELRGWCKDMDLYTLDGETVEPLPGRETAARARLHPRFNTRYAAGY